MKCNSIDRRILYILTNTEGEKFLGPTASLVNPCGDYWEKTAIREVMYEKALKNERCAVSSHLF